MTPDWHDYPTAPGVWVMRRAVAWPSKTYNEWEAYDVAMTTEGAMENRSGALAHLPRTIDPEDCTIRYYGPLPHDPQDQGETK